MDDCEKLHATVEEFCRFIEGLPDDALAEQEWGPKEVLAHLVFHHESYVAQVKARLAGQPFALLQGKFRELNVQAVVVNRGVPITRLVRRLREANEHLCALYASHDPSAIMLVIKQGAKPRTLAALVPEAEAHVRNHQRKLEREMRRRSR
jgi:hypothetical protein